MTEGGFRKKEYLNTVLEDEGALYMVGKSGRAFQAKESALTNVRGV